MTGYEPLYLHTSRWRTGDKLRGELVLEEGIPELRRAARVTIRVRGELEYDDEGTKQCEELSGGPESIKDLPIRGERRFPFALSLARDLPPSYQGKAVQISWEAVATLLAEDGEELTRWSQPLHLEPARTVHPPQWVEPSAPGGSALTAASTWGCLLFPVLCCFSPSLHLLFGESDTDTPRSGTEQFFGVIFSLAMMAVGLVLTWWLMGKVRTVSKFKAASLKPLAERLPLGATARLRVFLDLTTPLTVRGGLVKLEFHEELKTMRSTDPVPVQVPANLSARPHQFDVEFPIPRDFPPTFRSYLSTRCTLTLRLEGLEDMVLHAPLVLAPEVLDAAS